MTTRLNNTQIKQALTDIRNDLRNGTVRVAHADRVPALRRVIALELSSHTENTGKPEDVFSREYLNPQTLRRFNDFFAETPTGGCLAQDDVAWAVQNFINRRSAPWAFLARRQAETTEGATA